MTMSYRPGEDGWGGAPTDSRRTSVGGVLMPRAVSGYFGIPEHGVVAEVDFHLLDGHPVVDAVRVVGTRWPQVRQDMDENERTRLRA